MHFCIPSTQELYSEFSGTNYTAFNIYINGAFHCCLRYKQLYALHEELRRRCLEFGKDVRLPIFPPKRILPLTNAQLEARRAALEHYLQCIGQDARLAKSEIFQTFLLNAQLATAGSKGDLDTYGGGGGYAAMHVGLMNNYSVPVTGRVHDNTSTLLKKIAQCLKLPNEMVQYFCLFLAHINQVNNNLVLVRRLMDFESPFISLLHCAEPACQIVLRTSYWNPANDLKLIGNTEALNLLFLQAVADVEREWIISTPVALQKLRALQKHGLKREYLELVRELPLYACLQFAASDVDFPEVKVGNAKLLTYLISIGNKELSVRTALGAKIYETKFRVTRMRCWRVTAVHCADGEQADVAQYEPPGQLSFEYLMSKHVLRWITITSRQAMLMSVCLQAMVNELVLQQDKEKRCGTEIESVCPRLSESMSMPVIEKNNNNNNNNNATNSTSSSTTAPSSPTTPIKLVAFRRSLKTNPKVYTSSYAAVFFCKNPAETEATMQNDAFEERAHHDIAELFSDAKLQYPGFLAVSAPMVRYSKFEFRQLLRLNGVKLTFTPMIISDSFNNSEKARLNEFTTTHDDQPLIAQFAAANAEEFAKSAELIYPYVDGIDLNCGCPQSWAISKSYGCGLLRQPEIIHDIIQTTRRRLPKDFSISVKFRILSDISSTIEMARKLEHMGVTFLTLHGRTMSQSSADPVNVAALTAVKSALQVPFVANGNVRSWQDACDLYEQSGADGIMAARGLLANPTLFNPNCVEHKTTCLDCLQQWLDIAARAGESLQFQCFHHHLTFMWNSNFKRSERITFNQLTSKLEVAKFIQNKYNLSAHGITEPFKFTRCTYNHTDSSKSDNSSLNSSTISRNGKFFDEFISTQDEEEDDNDSILINLFNNK